MARKKKKSEEILNEVSSPEMGVLNEVAPNVNVHSEVEGNAPNAESEVKVKKPRARKPKKTEDQEVIEKVMDIASKNPYSLTPEDIEIKILEDKLVQEQQKGADAQFAEVAVKLLGQGRPESNVINILSAQNPSNRENITKYIKELGKKRWNQ